MGRYSVGIVKYGIDPNTRCFEDFGRALNAALRTLGHEVVPVTDGNPGRIIMLGAGHMSDPGRHLPDDAILFNTEQVSAITLPQRFISPRHHAQRVVWDYSSANIKVLQRIGFERVVHCPFGYHPSMTKIEPAEEEDIDVLFYGSVNPRREAILDGLERAGLKVERLFNVYDVERDRAIARAKVVLNLHHYPGGVFEIFRCSHLFANRKCVLSEAGGIDADLEAFASKTTRYVPYDKLVIACRALLADDVARRIIAGIGFSEFTKTSLADNVRRALEQS